MKCMGYGLNLDTDTEIICMGQWVVKLEPVYIFLFILCVPLTYYQQSNIKKRIQQKHFDCNIQLQKGVANCIHQYHTIFAEALIH